MIRLKAYLKRLSDRGYLQNLRPSDVPMNKTILQSPTYLTKEELKVVFNEADRRLYELIENKEKRSYIHAAYMLRAAIYMLYATGLRNAELRSLKPTDIDLEHMR
jgi:integrase